MSCPSSALPAPWPRRRDAGLAPAQQRLLVAGVVAAHVAAVWGLWQVREVREAVVEAVPMVFSIVQPAAPRPPAPNAPPKPVPPSPKLPPPSPVPVIAAEPSPAPATFVVPVQPVLQPALALAPPVAQAPSAPPAPPAPPAPAPVPRTISASEVQFLKTPVLQYPAASRRARETGRVVLRLFIDERGQPRQVQVNRSSGFPRLDDAAVAAIQQALFKPHTENAQPIGVWALVPIDFDLEK
ncbi:energy transducer TonB [Aquabacterium sp.]|uniref:energy transducer TonB n=1 Tax=Aquabacterium sp. TaxID=1872578 RepID=UPI003782E41D